jgi:hypothetical protein
MSGGWERNEQRKGQEETQSENLVHDDVIGASIYLLEDASSLEGGPPSRSKPLHADAAELRPDPLS